MSKNFAAAALVALFLSGCGAVQLKVGALGDDLNFPSDAIGGKVELVDTLAATPTPDPSGTPAAVNNTVVGVMAGFSPSEAVGLVTNPASGAFAWIKAKLGL